VDPLGSFGQYTCSIRDRQEGSGFFMHVS
jgi:hypothetical protein